MKILVFFKLNKVKPAPQAITANIMLQKSKKMPEKTLMELDKRLEYLERHQVKKLCLFAIR